MVDGLRQMTALFPEPEAEVVEHDNGGTTWNELMINPATAQLAPDGCPGSRAWRPHPRCWSPWTRTPAVRKPPATGWTCWHITRGAGARCSTTRPPCSRLDWTCGSGSKRD